MNNEFKKFCGQYDYRKYFEAKKLQWLVCADEEIRQNKTKLALILIKQSDRNVPCC